MEWAVIFKKIFQAFRASRGWVKRSKISKEDKGRRNYFLGPLGVNDSEIGSTIFETLSHIHRRDYFMSMLSDDLEAGPSQSYDEDMDPDTTASSTDAQKAHPMEIKQRILHLLATESLVAREVDGEEQGVQVFQSDFKWHGPSIPHSALFAVREFFGVSKLWLGFFQKFLEAPLRFIDDGSNAPIRVRRRGVPLSHTISDFFGESMLFCMDFAVNEATFGLPLYRLHDDFWFWSTDEQSCFRAWEAVTKLSSILGLELNAEKTGAAKIAYGRPKTSQKLPEGLPRGPLRWGLLELDEVTGAFRIDQKLIDTHVAELSHQLQSTSSILGWIRAYNTYIRYLVAHFCAPANCLGPAHIDDCLSTLNQIHHKCFPDVNGDVGKYVKAMIKTKFQVDGIPDGFIYFPLMLGGLELYNPFVSLQAKRQGVIKSPSEVLREATRRESESYRKSESRFDDRRISNRRLFSKDLESFMSLEEFTRFRREESYAFCDAWKNLLAEANEVAINRTEELNGYLTRLPVSETKEGIVRNWTEMTPYWKYICEAIGPEMIRSFGSLSVVERGLLPMGMVKHWRGKI